MPPVLFADNFLAGSLLTILMPLGLVIALTIWYLIAIVKRAPQDTPTSSASLPPPEVVAAAPPAETGVTPAEPPVDEP